MPPRRPGALEALARECEALGGDALAFACDVSSANEAHDLARAAVDRFGRIDVRVNDASVLAIGEFEDVPDEVFRQVVETNFFGVVATGLIGHGSTSPRSRPRSTHTPQP